MSFPHPPPIARAALDVLIARAPELAAIETRAGPLPWRVRAPGFPGLLQAIVAQQISNQAAAAIWSRIAALPGTLEPSGLLASSEEALRAAGLSRPKVAHARALAAAFEDGRLDARALAGMDDEAAVSAIAAVRGMGRWSAEIYLLFALGRQDVFPSGDLALAAAVADLKGLPGGRRPRRCKPSPRRGDPRAGLPPGCSGTTGATSPAAPRLMTLPSGARNPSFIKPGDHRWMSAEATAPALNMPLVQAYHPTTFLERGVAIPFTTPALSGARARPTERGGLEIVVPNPSGGRGVYILPWTGVCELCRPTVHDTLLNQRVAALRNVTPASIRQAARDIAAEGLAGREALAAAGRAAEGDRQELLVSNFLLLLALIQQVEPSELQTVSGQPAGATELEQRARRAVVRIGPKIGRAAEEVAETLEELAQAFAGIGAPRQTPAPRILRLLAALERLRTDMQAWSKDRSDDSAAQAAMIATVADLTIACAERTLADAHALTQNMAALLRNWSAMPDLLAGRIARPEWLVDGWEQICLIWHCANGDAGRRSALMEMASLVPALPREAIDWVGTQVEVDVVSRFRKTVRQNEDWRTGLVFERVARNEALRALAI